MIEFMNAALGLTLVLVGLIVIILIDNRKIKIKKDIYGNHIGFYTGLIILIMCGLFLLIREMIKL